MLNIELGNVSFPHCIWNAAGPNDVTLEELQTLLASESAAVTMKSCTKEPRDGNPKPRYKDLPHGSINSMGLPNLGYKQYVSFAEQLAGKKPIVASVSGLSLQDNIEIITAFNDSMADLIELNLSCPNIPGKPQVCYDFEQTEEVLGEVVAICKKPIGVKLSPYFDMVHFETAADILGKHRLAYLCCVNSVGNALFIDREKEQVVIKPKGGFGGLGGHYIKPTALANVRKFHELLNGKIPIVGVGGVYTGEDAFDFILAGATGVQVGTAFMQEGPGCFGRIRDELQTYMQKKGYTSLEDFRGTLKTL